MTISPTTPLCERIRLMASSTSLD